MDSIISGGVALCVFVVSRGGSELSGVGTPLMSLSVFILSIVAIKLSRATLRPYRVSELRKIPGPSVNKDPPLFWPDRLTSFRIIVF